MCVSLTITQSVLVRVTCPNIGVNFNCRVRFIVYSSICKLCHNTYVGSTSRFIRDRYAEHKRSLQKCDRVSALSQHMSICHGEQLSQISCFDFKILHKYRDSLDTLIGEAVYINRMQPAINRKHELVQYSVDFK